jgi:hypothetical protein
MSIAVDDEKAPKSQAVGVQAPTGPRFASQRSSEDASARRT